MIIKSLPRKYSQDLYQQFQNLYDYITSSEDYAGAEGYIIAQNLGFQPTREEVIQKFYDQSRKLKVKSDKYNANYHEIISIKRNHAYSLDEQCRILQQLAEQYIQERAKDLLVYGALHKEAEHLHFHLCISANNSTEPGKRFYFRKKDFHQIQVQMEKWLHERNPGMEDQVLFQKPFSERKNFQPSEAGYQYKLRTGKTTVKEELSDLVLQVLSAKSIPQFKELCQKLGIGFYERRIENIRAIGVTFKNRKFRLRKLGLIDDYVKAIFQIEQIEARLRQLAGFQEQNQPGQPSDSNLLSEDEFDRRLREIKERKAKEQEPEIELDLGDDF